MSSVQKTAGGKLDLLKSLFGKVKDGIASHSTVSPAIKDVAGAGIGAAAGEGLTRLEHAGAEGAGITPGPIGSTANHGLNLFLGTALGTRWGRRGMLKSLDQETGKLVTSPNRLIWGTTGKVLGAGGMLAVDPTLNIVKNLSQGSEGIGQFGKSMTESAADRIGPDGKLIPGLTKTLDAIKGNVAGSTEALNKGIGDISSNLNAAAGEIKNTSANIGKDMSVIGSNLSGASAGIGDIAGNVSKLTEHLTPGEEPGRLEKLMSSLTGATDKVNQLGDFVARNKAPLAGAAAGVGALYLMGKYLEGRRRPEEKKAASLKTAGPKWELLKGFFKDKVAPVAVPTAIGAAEAKLNYELDPEHPSMAGLGGVLGFMGGRKFFDPKGTLGRTLAPYLVAGGTIIPRGLAATSASTRSSNAQTHNLGLQNKVLEKQIATGVTGPTTNINTGGNSLMDSNAAKIIGGSLLGAGALYAISNLVKSKRDQSAAAPTIIQQAAAPTPMSADGSPLPPPAAGGAAGGGGTLRVTLPTRRPTDQETQVEIPLERIGLSNALMNKIKRDTKRRLRSESDARTYRMIGATPTPIAV